MAEGGQHRKDISGQQLSQGDKKTVHSDCVDGIVHNIDSLVFEEESNDNQNKSVVCQVTKADAVNDCECPLTPDIGFNTEMVRSFNSYSHLGSADIPYSTNFPSSAGFNLSSNSHSTPPNSNSSQNLQQSGGWLKSSSAQGRDICLESLKSFYSPLTSTNHSASSTKSIMKNSCAGDSDPVRGVSTSLRNDYSDDNINSLNPSSTGTVLKPRETNDFSPNDLPIENSDPNTGLFGGGNDLQSNSSAGFILGLNQSFSSSHGCHLNDVSMVSNLQSSQLQVGTDTAEFEPHSTPNDCDIDASRDSCRDSSGQLSMDIEDKPQNDWIVSYTKGKPQEENCEEQMTLPKKGPASDQTPLPSQSVLNNATSTAALAECEDQTAQHHAFCDFSRENEVLLSNELNLNGMCRALDTNKSCLDLQDHLSLLKKSHSNDSDHNFHSDTENGSLSADTNTNQPKHPERKNPFIVKPPNVQTINPMIIENLEASSEPDQTYCKRIEAGFKNEEEDENDDDNGDNELPCKFPTDKDFIQNHPSDADDPRHYVATSQKDRIIAALHVTISDMERQVLKKSHSNDSDHNFHSDTENGSLSADTKTNQPKHPERKNPFIVKPPNVLIVIDKEKGKESKTELTENGQYQISVHSDALTIYDGLDTDNPVMFPALMCVAPKDVCTFAVPFLHLLRSWGYCVFLPERDLNLTGPYHENLARVIRERCNGKIIVVVSHHYPDSDECLFLTYFAKQLDPAAKWRSIIPVYIDKDIAKLPEVLAGLSSIRYNEAVKKNFLRPKMSSALDARGMFNVL